MYLSLRSRRRESSLGEAYGLFSASRMSDRLVDVAQAPTNRDTGDMYARMRRHLSALRGCVLLDTSGLGRP